MLQIKIQSALFTYPILILLLPIGLPVVSDATYLQNVFLYGLYAIPIVFIYGTITSMIAEVWSMKLRFKRISVTSFLLHLLFGWLFAIPFNVLYIGFEFEKEVLLFGSLVGMTSAVIYFCVNRLLNRTLKAI